MGRAIPVTQNEEELDRWSNYLASHAPHISRNAAMRAGLRIAMTILDEDPGMLEKYLVPMDFARGSHRPRKPK